MLRLQRQDDLLIKKVPKLPKGLKVKNDNVVLRGEATGHAHRLEGGEVLAGKDGLIFLKVEKEAKLKHEEHDTLKLGPGTYSVVRQREYTNENAARLVVD